MLTAMGLGWTFFLVGMLMAGATAFLWVEWKWGMGWRQKRWQTEEKKKQAEKEKKAQEETSKDPEA